MNFATLISQFDAYRSRKSLSFKRMKIATLGLCIVIVFLSWLQHWLPMKNRQFWNKGKRFLSGINATTHIGHILASDTPFFISFSPLPPPRPHPTPFDRPCLIIAITNTSIMINTITIVIAKAITIAIVCFPWPLLRAAALAEGLYNIY